MSVQQSSNLRTHTREAITLAEGVQVWNLDRNLMTRKQSIQAKKNYSADVQLSFFVYYILHGDSCQGQSISHQ